MPATDSADINLAATPPAALPPAFGQPDFVGRTLELRALLTALEYAERGVGGRGVGKVTPSPQLFFFHPSRVALPPTTGGRRFLEGLRPSRPPP
jgi:hypothetical protein